MADPITATRHWVEKLVIGLNPCPFAALPFRQERIRFALFATDDAQTLAEGLWAEAQYLLQTDTDELETTLLIHPNCLTDFADYLDFVAFAETLFEQQGLHGILQLASFHPAYQFAGTASTDVENYTNRSPYPMLHLIREASVETARETYPDIEAIPERNIARLRTLGLAEIRRRLQG